MAMFSLSLVSKPLSPVSLPKPSTATLALTPATCLSFRYNSTHLNPAAAKSRPFVRAAAVDGDYSAKRSSGSSSGEPRETIMLPGCDYNHWLIAMEFPKDPAPTREQMIDTYLNTLATVLGRSVRFCSFLLLLLLLLFILCFCVWLLRKRSFWVGLTRLRLGSDFLVGTDWCSFYATKM